MTLSEEIKSLLGDILPAVNPDADFLFSELDSLGVATILYALSRQYGIELGAEDTTPKNFRNIESLAAMVRSKMRLEEKIRSFALSAPDRPALICAAAGRTAVGGSETDSEAGAGAGAGSGVEVGAGAGSGAALCPNRPAVLTYAQLWKAILAKSAELTSDGLKSGRPYVFRATQDADFIVTYCAVHLLGAVAVPLGAGETEANFLAVKKETESVLFPGSESPQGGSSAFPDGISDILFTTGTTGKSKGVMLSESYYAACTGNFLAEMPFGEDLLFIVSGPLNHIASLLKLYPVLSTGGTLYIIDGLKNMNLFFDAFNLPFKRFATFLVPASIRMLLQFSREKLRSLSSKIAFIETGAAPITKADMELLSDTLPDSGLYNTYGGTEIGCAASYNFNDGKHLEGCVGKPLKNSSVEIADDGTVVVSGRNIMSGYLNDAESTREVLRDGRIHLSDTGCFDENGLLHLTGRLGDVINVGGYKVNPLEVENAAASFPGVRDCICVAAAHPVIGPVLKLLVQTDAAPRSSDCPDAPQFDRQALARHLKSRLESYKVPVLYETVPEIRHTFNGKKDRKFYR